MKKVLKILVDFLFIFNIRIWMDIIVPILWIITIPVRLVGWIFGIKSMQIDNFDVEENLNTLRQNWYTHYTIVYLIWKLKLKIGFIF